MMDASNTAVSAVLQQMIKTQCSLFKNTQTYVDTALLTGNYFQPSKHFQHFIEGHQFNKPQATNLCLAI